MASRPKDHGPGFQHEVDFRSRKTPSGPVAADPSQRAFDQKLGEIPPPIEHGKQHHDTAIETKTDAVGADEQFSKLLEADGLELRDHTSPPRQRVQRGHAPPQVLVERQRAVRAVAARDVFEDG